MKKVFSVIVTLCLMFCAIFTGQTVSAATYNSFEYKINGKYAVITKYLGSSSSLSVPSKIDGYTVNGIDAYAFFDNDYIKSLTLPSSVTTISDCAFADCSKLTTVTFSKGLKSIGAGAFSQCKKLQNVTLPSSVTQIKKSAFENCDGFTLFTFPSSVTVITDYVLNHCDSLTTITIGSAATTVEPYAFENISSLASFKVVSDNVNFTASKGVLYSKDMSILYRFASNSSLTSYSVPKGVCEIKPHAFYGAKKLTSITLPTSVNTIGKKAFYGTALYNNKDNWSDDLLYISRYLIECNSTATSIIINQNTKTIADFAFYNCKNLQSVTLPTTLTYLGVGVFAGCDNLQSIEIDSANKYYTCIKGILCDKNLTTVFAFPQNSASTSLNLKTSIKKIAPYAFIGAKNLKGINLKYVEYIGDYAFYNTPLTTVHINSHSVGNFAFAYSSIKNARLATKVRYVGAKAFYNCVNLKSVNINATDLSSLGAKSIGYIYSDEGDVQKNVVIYSTSSVAKKYAEENALTFKTSDTPLISDVSYNSNGVKLKWTKLYGINGYRVYRRSANQSSWTRVKSATTSNSFTDTTANFGEVYYYTVRACYKYTSGNVWTSYDKVGSSAVYMAAPVSKISSATTSSITVKWNKVNGAYGYRVYRRLSNESSWTRIKSKTTATYFTDTSAKRGNTYYYTVRAYLKVDDTYHWSLYDNTGVKAKLK